MVENNRSLECKNMNHLDHALGRPDNPHHTARNFFGVSIGSPEAQSMALDPNWRHVRDFMGTSGFAVSEIGRNALEAYLQENWVRPRSYRVEYGYIEGETISQTVQADTPSQARYSAWDADFHGTFKEFLGQIVSVRLA